MFSVRPALILCASFVVLAPSLAQAATIEASSQVAAATVFSDRALVTRRSKVHLPAGPHIITLADMPAGINEASLRVQGKAVGTVKIGTVEVKRVYLTEQANAAEREKTTALEAKNDEKAMVEGEIKALEARREFIARIVASGADNHDEDQLSKLDFAPEKWSQAWTLLQSGMGETEKNLALKRIAIRKLDADIAKLQEELNRVKTSQAKQRRDVHVNVEAAQETDLDLSLTYQTGGAAWRPVYDARLDTNSGSLDMEQYGQVSQQTGEDWGDVELTLSTAQPSGGSEMPRMSEWLVSLYQPVMAKMKSAAGTVFRAFGGLNESQDAAMPSAVGVAEMKEEDATPVQAVAQTTEYAAEFKVPGRVALKSTRDSSKMYIGASKMKAVLTAQVSPRLTPQAYLFAKVTNGESYPLIPGSVSKYRDGGFIGNAPLPLLRPSETADLSFGVDDRIKVSYQRIHEEQTNPALVVVGDMKIERHYQTKIQNLHKDALNITVFEQYPVAADPDVKVDLLDSVTTKGYTKDLDTRQGVITWAGSYNPREEKTFTIGFVVKFPKDRQISGL
ncbi:MAG: mucoidy inhibitor MuiA family protein [Alphaproteobacteria bacterium]|nr:mucoidy inhibitor MuiA family protein [Alphaproteobacteria bacterium]